MRVGGERKQGSLKISKGNKKNFMLALRVKKVIFFLKLYLFVFAFLGPELDTTLNFISAG